MAQPQTTGSFDELIRTSRLPVLADFWAEWCGPCRMVSPVVEQIAAEYKGQMVTVKVNVDKKQHVAAAHQISSIPTIMLFRNGKAVMRLTGALPYETLKKEIDSALRAE